MNRTEIIQFLINKSSAEKYLEIGISEGYNFNQIKCMNKVGVDPSHLGNPTFRITSDEFFQNNTNFFDVIFIDGLHESNQVYKDIQNSLSFLNPNGHIICHDMNPDSEIIQRVPRETGEWTGDCWKAWVRIRSENPNLLMHVVDTDYGCGIISRGKQDLLKLNEELTWEYLSKNRKYCLNLISVDDFVSLYK
jgi:hypothetical protein